MILLVNGDQRRSQLLSNRHVPTQSRMATVGASLRQPCVAGDEYLYLEVTRSEHRCHDRIEKIAMLSVIVIQLLVLWLLGMATSYTMGGILYLLLVVAIAAAPLRIIQGRGLRSVDRSS